MRRMKKSAMPMAIATLMLVGFTASISSLAAGKNGSMSGEMDIVDTAVAAGNFSTLAAALDAARPDPDAQRRWAFHSLCTDRRGIRETSRGHS